MPKNTENTSYQLKHTLLQRIEEDQLQPHSRLFFTGRELMVWALWLLSVAVGALAVAISVFVVVHHQYALYEATHKNFFTFLVDILPFVWLLVFVGMAYCALYNLRHTRRGYRYSLTTVLASSIVLSFALGSALQYFGLGYAVDSLLGKQMNIYMSQEKVELSLWQQPAAGRLVGVQRHETVDADKYVIFEDMQGGRWRLNVVELMPYDKTLLANKNPVRVLGKLTDGQAKLFHACGVFAWVFNDNVTRSDLSSDRETFVQKMAQFRKQAADRLVRMEEKTRAAATTSQAQPASVCANLAIVR